jgi:hypothetical protein
VTQCSRGAIRYSSSSPFDDEGLDEASEPHEGAEFDSAGPGEAQLWAAGSGAGVGVDAALGAADFEAEGLVAADLAAFFFAGLLALAFLADFFGAAALDFLADLFAVFFADFLAFLADLAADFFEDFFADFFFAARSLVLDFLAFLPFLFFLPLAIVILLLPPINVYRAFQVVRLERGANRSIQSWPGTTCRPIEKLNRVDHRN